MTVRLSDVNIFDVAKVEIKKTEKGYAIHLWDGELFCPTATIYVYQNLQGDKKVELEIVGEEEKDE